MKSGKDMFKAFFGKKAHDFRIEKNLTQECMAELLHVVPRSYVDLEHGRFCPSGLTIAWFLAAQTDEEKLKFIHEFLAESEREEQNHG